MKRYILMILALLPAFCACQPSQKAEEPAAQAEAKPAESRPLQVELMDKEKADEIKNAAKGALEKGYHAPPRARVELNIVAVNDKISNTDAERSYAFRKSAIHRCYMTALAYEYMVQGEVKMALTHADTRVSEVSDFSSTIRTEGFESCVQEAAKSWPLPAGARIEVSLNFTSKPAPTPEELRKQFGRDDEHGDEHHEGAEMPEMPAVPEIPAAPAVNAE